MSTSAERDFFISYNKADRRWAEWIAWQLEDAGWTTVLQAWDFVPGSNFVLEMDRAERLAKRTIAVLSPDYLSASFPQPEWSAAFADDPEGLKRKLVPVRVRECKPEGLLAQVVNIDLVGLDEDFARERLLAGVGERLKPAHAPSFPGGVPHIEPEAPTFPGDVGAVSPMPSPEPRIWVKVDDLIFAVEDLNDLGDRITLKGRLEDEVVRRLEALRTSSFGAQRLRFVHGDHVADAQLASLRRRMHSGSTEVTIELERAEQAPGTALRASTGGMTPDDLVEAGLRNLLLGEPLPERLGLLEHMADPGVDTEALARGFELPDPEAAAFVRLTLAEGLIGSGNAAAITRFNLGPREGESRLIALEWEEPRTYGSVEPARRRIEGEWRVAL
jgi:hypothetical protein